MHDPGTTSRGNADGCLRLFDGSICADDWRVAPVRLRLRCAPATPDTTLRPLVRCGCATRSPKGEAWWARQPSYEAAFLEGSLGLTKMLIQRVPTKMPTKLQGRRRCIRRPEGARKSTGWRQRVDRSWIRL